MKKIHLLVFTLVVFASVSGQGYQVNLKTPNFSSGVTYLTYYMGNNFNVADSAAISNKGTAVFKGAKKLPPGIYAIFFPGNRLHTEFLIDKEQNISVTADTTDLVNKTVVTGSKENILYDQYQKFASAKGRLIQQERTAYGLSLTKEDSALHERNYNLYNKQLNDYRESIVKNQPNSMMAALLKAMKEPAVPTKIPVTKKDSLDNYYAYKDHYWDGITFMDDRIIRTPFFLRKLERYYREVISPAPDSIIKDVDYKLLLARSAPEMYKFLLNWLTDEYINPKYMGQDAVFVHLFEKYHSKGLTSWLNETQMDAITRRAYMLMSNLIGDKAADLEMVDRDNKPVSLYNVQADYTVVCFWDPNCGHCKEVVPRLDSMYKAGWKQHGVKIFGMLTPDGKETNVMTAWSEFISKHKLDEWVHVYQTKDAEAKSVAEQRPSFRQLYDITMTPTLYLLDKEKRIIAKKLTWEQINELLEVKWKTPSAN